MNYKIKKLKMKRKLREKKLALKQKGEKNIFLTISKIIFVIAIFLAQVFIMYFLYLTAKDIYRYATFSFEIIKIIAILLILHRHDESAYKISWILFIMFFPVVGVLVFYLWGNSKLKKKNYSKINDISSKTKELLPKNVHLENEIKKLNPYKYNQVKYMKNVTGFPVYENLNVEYFKTGEIFFENLKIDLMKAKKYILIEFYILSTGKLWKEISKILIKKANEGVKIQIIVDSLGSLPNRPKNLIKEMNKAGIEVYIFNPFNFVISGYLNYRDHRKIVVIDGVCSYTGGVNLADEYANIIKKYGYWKDVGIKFYGESVWSNTLIFLRTLEQLKEEKLDYMWYKNNMELEQKIYNEQNKELVKNKKGYILPYSDGPENRKCPIENIYIQTINNSKNYVYITTPYFIISENLLTALLNSSRSGVDVKIILPHIPDKKMVQIVTRSYYEVLLEAGIKVYEFKPGFIHSKTFVVDDDTSIVGTANLDYRSTHLNFECATWMYRTGEEINIKKDFEEMLDKCIEVKLENCKKKTIIYKAIESLLKAFSPML